MKKKHIPMRKHLVFESLGLQLLPVWKIATYEITKLKNNIHSSQIWLDYTLVARRPILYFLPKTMVFCSFCNMFSSGSLQERWLPLDHIHKWFWGDGWQGNLQIKGTHVSLFSFRNTQNLHLKLGQQDASFGFILAYSENLF